MELERNGKNMCVYCSNIKLVPSFFTPNVYEMTIEYIKELISKDGFILIDGNCEIGKHKNENGHWVDDIVFHTIKCPKCGQVYSCSVNTYRGSGSFSKV